MVIIILINAPVNVKKENIKTEKHISSVFSQLNLTVDP